MTEIAACRRAQSRRAWAVGGALLLALACTVVWRVTLGEWDIPLPRVLYLLSPRLPEAEASLPEALVIRSVRLPRLFAAVGTGGLLSVSGALLQGILANPLAEPYTLGIAAGAAFGGACGLILNSALVTPMAFAGAVAALWLVGLIAWRSGGGGAHLVLAGVIANAVLSAGVTFLKAVADDRLGAIVLWLMGSFSGAGPEGAAAVWAAAVLVLLPAWACGPMLDAVSLGEGRGAMLGVDEAKLRRLLLCAASLGTAAAVSRFGIVGFVGLVVPHLVRLTVGPAHRPLSLLCFLAGGTLLAAADGFAQRMGELPVGVLTALIGGPFFCWLLMRRGAR